jgi:hypothetical protein
VVFDAVFLLTKNENSFCKLCGDEFAELCPRHINDEAKNIRIKDANLISFCFGEYNDFHNKVTNPVKLPGGSDNFLRMETRISMGD